MRLFSPFDYFVFAIGAIGTLNVFGVPIRMPQLILIILGGLSGMICCFSILPLAFDRFVPRLDRQQRRIHAYHVLVNLIPTIYVLTHLRETPWGRFTC
jgi:hypothetical protein